jgi:alpha-L-fucosidase 2
MGCLIFGAPERERLCINEDSLWTGDENPSGDYDTMGAYQVMGNVYVDLPAHKNAADYGRELDLATAQARVSYEAGGVHYQREFFCSHPAGLLVARFTADKPHSYSGTVRLEDGHGAVAVGAADGLLISGKLSNGLKYE